MMDTFWPEYNRFLQIVTAKQFFFRNKEMTYVFDGGALPPNVTTYRCRELQSGNR